MAGQSGVWGSILMVSCLSPVTLAPVNIEQPPYSALGIGYFGIPEAALSKAVSSICLPFDALWTSSSKAKPT